MRISGVCLSMAFIMLILFRSPLPFIVSTVSWSGLGCRVWNCVRGWFVGGWGRPLSVLSFLVFGICGWVVLCVSYGVGVGVVVGGAGLSFEWSFWSAGGWVLGGYVCMCGGGLGVGSRGGGGGGVCMEGIF
jgi:hypothetical protein